MLFARRTSTVDYYIVRHAEKAPVDSVTKTSDVPLSDKGRRRAEGLKEELKNKNIRYIFSTNTLRTKTTAEPLSKATGIPVEIYDGSDKNFVEKLKGLDGKCFDSRTRQYDRRFSKWINRQALAQRFKRQSIR